MFTEPSRPCVARVVTCELLVFTTLLLTVTPPPRLLSMGVMRAGPWMTSGPASPAMPHLPAPKVPPLA